MRGGVRVAADDGHARLGEAELRSDDVHDALLDVAERVQPDAELLGVPAQRLDLGARDRVGDRLVQVEGRHVVVFGARPSSCRNRRAGSIARAQLQHLSEQHEHGDDDGRVEVGLDAAMRPESLRKYSGRNGRDGAVDERRADADADQREHVRACVHERRPHPLEERPAAPQHDRRRQHELDPVHGGGAEAVHQRSAAHHVAHRQQEDRAPSDDADPEAARHVDELGVRRVDVSRGDVVEHRLERHAALRTRARACR